MNAFSISNPPIQISSLEAAIETDHSIYDGIITIENTETENPLRVDKSKSPQLILRFDDITYPVDDWVEPSTKHIERAFSFWENTNKQSVLIHCHMGISRSSGIALAIIAKELGPGREQEAVKILETINPYCAPNALVVWLADELLSRGGKLYHTAEKHVPFTGSYRG